jgi:hypothetical protein
VTGLEMLPTIQLDNEPCGVRNEIDNVRSDRCLAAETNAKQSMGADRTPDNLLSFGGICS